MKELKIVIVGHVDHGKSTLIGRLLFDTNSLHEEKLNEVKKTCEELGRDLEFGFVMDHLQEEREQGITIDTAQVFFKSSKRNYVIIDAPGHKEFLKNMITGASQAEGAILIVDVSEGVKEQTKRHAYILSLLGLKQVIVVMNKMDLVNYSEEKFMDEKKELIEFLDQLKIKTKEIIPISSKKGDNIFNKSKNINWYNGPTVLESLDSFETIEKVVNPNVRFPAQDVYKIDDKRIIVGRLESGKLTKGDEIISYPNQEKTKIKSIEIFEDDRGSVEAGESIGITTDDPIFIERGNVISKGNPPKITKEIKGNLFWMSKKDIKIGDKINIKMGTQKAICSIEKIEKKINSSTLEEIKGDFGVLKNTEVGAVILKTSKDLCIDNFNDIPELGRFVIERGEVIVGGGIIC